MKISILKAMLLGVSCALSMSYAVVRSDVTVRNLSTENNQVSADVRVAWYGDTLDDAKHAVQITNAQGKVLAQTPISVPVDVVNSALKATGQYRTGWLSVSSKGLSLTRVDEKLYVNVIALPDALTTRSARVSKVEHIRQGLSVRPSSVVAQNVKVNKSTTKSGEPVTISGEIVESKNNQAVPFVEVELIVANKQFEIPIIVNTDEQGTFHFDYMPQGTMSGEHRVSIVQPGESNRPEQAVFNVTKAVKAHTRAAKVINLEFARSLVKTGVRFKDRVLEKILIQNKGTVPVGNAKVSITSKDGFTWGRIVSQDENPSVKKDWEVHVEFAPPKTFKKEGDYDFMLNLEYGVEPNIVKRNLPIKVKVTNNQVGSYTFRVEDIYTDYKGKGGNKGLPGARVRLVNDNIKSLISTGKTEANGELTFDKLPIGFYSYQVSADGHTSKFGEVYVRPGTVNREKVFLDIPTVKVDWTVVETTIKDKYEIVVEATYETDVPAPVLVMKPAVLELPNMQRGEIFKGAFKITNEGLISARDFRSRLPKTDKFIEYRFEEESLPEKLLPQQTVYLPYVLKAKKGFPLTSADFRAPKVVNARESIADELLGRKPKVTARRTCNVPCGYRSKSWVIALYFCANDDEDETSAGSDIVAYGSCTTDCGGTGLWHGGGWGWGWGWG